MSEPPVSAVAASERYRFGAFELRPYSRQLLRDGVEVPLQAKVFDLIAYLVRHADRVIDKNELLDAVWPRQVVTEAALSRCVMKVRRALDDDAAEPRILLTVHGRGYRLLTPVHALPPASPPSAPAPVADTPVTVDPDRAPTASAAIAPSPALSPPSSTTIGDGPAAAGRGRHGGLFAVAATLLLAIGLGAWFTGQSDQAIRGDRPLRLAVLPIDNATGDERLDWARLGLMGSIGEILRHGDGVRVLGAREVLDLQQALADLDAGQQLQRLHDAFGVTHVVSGRLDSQPGQLRLSYSLRSDRGNERRRTVVAGDVGGLAHAVGADLRAVLGLRGLAGNPISDDEFANEAFLRGRALRLQGDARGALDYFRLAAEQAPQAFWPRYEAALCLRDLGESEAAVARLQALLAEVDAGDALEPRLGVRNALGILHWRAGRLSEAQQRLDEALQIAEQQGDQERIATVLTNLGILARYRGDNSAGRQHLTRAIEAMLAAGLERPSPHVLHSLARIEIDDGDFAGADQHLQAALAHFRLVGDRRNEAISLNSLATLRRLQGRFGESREFIEQALVLHRALSNPGSEASALLTLADAEAMQGLLGAAIGHAEQALQLALTIGESPRVAVAELQLGRYERARGAFEAAAGWFERALARMQADEDGPGELQVRLQQAELSLAIGDTDGAEHRLTALIGPVAELGRARLLEAARRLLARAKLARGDAQAARDWLDPAPDRRSPRPADGEHWLLLAELALLENDPDAAADALAQADPLLAHDPRPAMLAARLAHQRGDLPAALAAEQNARQRAGERWLATDEQRLAAREQAATSR